VFEAEVEIMSFTTMRSSYVIAGDVDAPAEILAYFMVHYDAAIRARVAGNPAITRGQLFELANDEVAEVRIAVAENPSTPASFIELLAEDDDPDVRFAIAENHNTPTYILSMLVRDENPYVADRALRTLERVWPTTIKSTSSFAAAA
jgi:hypothetical protein